MAASRFALTPLRRARERRERERMFKIEYHQNIENKQWCSKNIKDYLNCKM